MCGVAGIFGPSFRSSALEAMVKAQQHRGPDASGVHLASDGRGGLGSNRLAIIDLSSAGDQPLGGPNDTWIAFNGEVYNHPELRPMLPAYPFGTRTDTEVVLAAFHRWGESCLDHLVGMFAMLVWDEDRSRLVAARDRFGVKPLYYHLADDGTLYAASQVSTIHAAGIPAVADEKAWATYLATGMQDHGARTFWKGISSLPPGHLLVWENETVRVRQWYDLASEIGDRDDPRSADEVVEEYRELLKDSVRLRFRSDVPVGVNLSGGLDSSTLLGLLPAGGAAAADVRAYTFTTGDPRYDETPWVEQMLNHTGHPSTVVELAPTDVARLATSVQRHADGPFGGLPTLAYAALFERARADGTIVLLDGQGLDEQWAGYDYYLGLADGHEPVPVVQGSQSPVVRPDCLVPGFRALAEDSPIGDESDDAVRRVQLRDVQLTKLPRALRYNDRVSMRSSTELREPFLDHRLVELALRQPADRKVRGGVGKWLLRELAHQISPTAIVTAPKRPVQTPQREWLRGPIGPWAWEHIQIALEATGDHWLDGSAVLDAWDRFQSGEGDNSNFVWQWVSIGLAVADTPSAFGALEESRA